MTCPTCDGTAIEDRDDAYQMCQMLQRRLDAYIAMEGRLNMEINTALNERDEARDERDRLVAYLRLTGWTGDVEEL